MIGRGSDPSQVDYADEAKARAKLDDEAGLAEL